jgi:hypothetical protein
LINGYGEEGLIAGQVLKQNTEYFLICIIPVRLKINKIERGIHMNRQLNPKRYMYLDVQGIDSLYSQIVTRTEIETITSRGIGRKTHISGKIGLGNAIGSLLGLLKIDGTAGTESSVNSEENVKSIHSSEQKLNGLIEYLSRMDEYSLFTDLDSASEYLKENNDAVFINSKCNFDTPQFWKGDVDQINKDGNLLLTQGMNPFASNDDENVFRSMQLKLMMSASISKFPGCQNGMGATSHEALLLRGHKGTNIPLLVFGTFFRNPEYYQIKPYAISF